MSKHDTPSLTHLTPEDLEHVYDPSEDTFLFLDALDAEQEFLLEASPQVVVEVGTGSGCVSAFLASWLHGPLYFATDINPYAAQVAQRTFVANNANVQVVRTDFFNGFSPALSGQIDVVLFNPPYVPTEEEEVGSMDIAAAWAGGFKGRTVIDRFLPQLEVMLSPKGCCYLVIVEENDPVDIARVAKTLGLRSEVIMRRGAGIERLAIVKLQREA